MRIIDIILLRAIMFYQKRISSYKGYACAYASVHGGASCSEWGRKIVEKHGSRLFIPLIRRRLSMCAHSAKVANNESNDGDEKLKKNCKETVACCGLESFFNFIP